MTTSKPMGHEIGRGNAETYTARQLVIVASAGGTIIGALERISETSVLVIDPMVLMADPQNGSIQFRDLLFPTNRMEVFGAFTLFKLCDMESRIGDVVQQGYQNAQVEKRTGLDLSSNHHIRPIR